MARRRLRNKLVDPLKTHLRKFARQARREGLSRSEVKSINDGLQDTKKLAKLEAEIEDSMADDVKDFAAFASGSEGGERPILNWLWGHRAEIWAIFSKLLGIA